MGESREHEITAQQAGAGNGATGAIGVRTADLEVPDPQVKGAALLPPAFPEPMGKWLLGRQEGVDEAGYAYPFVMQDQAFVPAARPVLRTGQAIPFSLLAYNLASGDLAVAGRLLDVDGDPVGAVTVAVDARGPSAFAGQEQLSARLVATGAAAGRYTLQVTVTDVSGAVSTSEIQVVVEG